MESINKLIIKQIINIEGLLSLLSFPPLPHISTISIKNYTICQNLLQWDSKEISLCVGDYIPVKETLMK